MTAGDSPRVSHFGLECSRGAPTIWPAVEVRPVGRDEPQLDEQGRRVFRPIRHGWRVEVAHGRLGRSRRLAKRFENTTRSATGWLQLACVAAALDAGT